MFRVFRLAVLECDTPYPAIKAARGSYGDIFRQVLTQGLNDLGERGSHVQLQVSKWDVRGSRNFPNIDEADGFLLTGSTLTAFDNDPWILSLVEFVQTVLATTEKPVLGICFGHQIIARALGAKVGVNPGGWELSVENIDLNEEGQELFGVSSLQMHQVHRDAVLEVPQGVVNLGSTPRCAIHALYRPGRILSFQGHPEFDSFINSQWLEAKHKSKSFDDQMFEDAIGRVQRPHSGAFLSSKICDFLLASQPAKSLVLPRHRRLAFPSRL